jgi:chromosomal replication initiation ATPase DnaA
MDADSQAQPDFWGGQGLDPPATLSEIAPLACQDRARAALLRPLPWTQPLLALSGPEGTGKTMLLRAWCAGCGARIVEGREVRGTPWGAHGLAIDALDRGVDPHVLWALINRVQAAGVPLVLAGRGEPVSWARGVPDLASRLRSALRVDIGPLTPADFEQLVVALARRRFLRLDAEALVWMLDRVERTHAAALLLVEEIDRACRQDPTARPLRWVQRALDTHIEG